MSRKHVASKASSLPYISPPEPASIRPVGRMRPTWLRADSFDPSGFSFARISITKFCAVLAFLIVSTYLVASVLLCDEGIEDVNAQHLATLMGQAITCVAVYSTVDPLDSRTIDHVVSRVVDAALDAHEHFMDQVNNF